MLSLDNTYNEEELRNWERRVHELSGRKDVEYVCELKLDGMSLALTTKTEGWREASLAAMDDRRRCHTQRANRAFDPAFDSTETG